MGCRLTAYKVADATDWAIVPASGKRDWMDATREKFAYRCLPLVMANQVGFDILSPINFVATWSGKPDIHAITFRFPDGEHPANRFVASHFGHGVMTISLPWLFRTSRGYGLWARGPTNSAKEHLAPLDGIIETDWAPYTFTMNWRFTKRQADAYFRRGEPVCTIVPIPLDLPESVEPEFREIDEDPQLKLDFFRFTSRRSGNINKLAATGESQWSMDYMRGHLPDGTEVSTHRKAFKLREFVQGVGARPPSAGGSQNLPAE
jgi:hypothetical protein